MKMAQNMFSEKQHNVPLNAAVKGFSEKVP
jgi:hypothetical protein